MRHIHYLLSLLLQLFSLLVIGQSAENDSLLRIILENRQDLAENRALNALATNYTRTDMVKAKSFLFESIELAQKLDIRTQLGYAYAQMVTVQLNTGHIDSAKYFLNLLQKLAKDSKDETIKANFNFAAGLFYKIQQDFKAALPYMKESLNEAAAVQQKNPSATNQANLAGQNLNIGNTYIQMGEYKNALQYHLNALRLFEGVNNKKGISFCFQSIGGDFVKLGQFNQALRYTTNGIAIKEELKDQRGIATGLEQMGAVYQGLKQYDSALYYFDQSLKIVQEMKLMKEEVSLYTNLGKVYGLKKDISNASLNLEKGKFLALQMGDSVQVSVADAELTAMRSTNNKQRQTERKLLSSLSNSIETGNKASELQNYQYLADHYAQNGQFEKALDYTNKYHLISDSLQSMDVQMQMKRLEEQYNLEKKEQEIVLLKKDQQLNRLSLQKQKTFQIGAVLFLILLLLIGLLIINRYRIVHKARQMVEMEKIRNTIARDLHDDIGSTLTSINILSNIPLQSGEREDELVNSNLQKINERSSAIMEKMDDIVWAINPQNDNMEQLLSRMNEFATEILEPLNINFIFEEKGDFSQLKLDVKKRKDFYLLFKEAINNAAKYSKCKTLVTCLYQNQEILQMEIRDDGKGFVEQEVSQGNGLSNMRQRAAAMAANLLIDSNIGKGTRIVLDLNITSLGYRQ